MQRVTEASVTVDGEVTGQIGRGLLVLCGIHEDDDDAAAEWAARKLLNIRLWEEEPTSGGGEGKAWARSAVQNTFGILLVSQFTLFATLKGNKPDFHRAMGPTHARPYWERFVARVEATHKGPVQQGRFGAKMDVHLHNDGPVTILLDSPRAPEAAPAKAEGEADKASPACTVAASSSVAAAASPRALLVLRAAGASTPLRSLQERGLKLCALKTLQGSPSTAAASWPPLGLAVVLQAPSGGSCGAATLAALATRCCEGWLLSEVTEHWQTVFEEAEVCA